MKKIYLTCLNSENYIYGVLALNDSIRKFCNDELYVLCTKKIKEKFLKIFNEEKIKYIIAENITIEESIKSRLEKTTLSHWINTFFKLNMFNLEKYDKIIYLDSDMLLLDNINELFDMKAISAVDDGDFMILGYNKGMNSGLLVFTPDVNDYKRLVSSISYVGTKREFLGDQGVIQENFPEFKEDCKLHLNIKYNACFYLLDKYKINDFKIIHFIGNNKPWKWNNVYAFIRIYSYLIRGRKNTYKYTKQYYKLLKKYIKKYKKVIKNVKKLS